MLSACSRLYRNENHCLEDLRGCYSNPEAQEAVALAEQAIDGLAAEGTPPCHSAPVRRWRLADRLGEQIIRKLLADRRSGATKRELVERYGISMSSVKRILRR
jgi:DNA invertase Pin-like site-specific DNA recombinase